MFRDGEKQRKRREEEDGGRSDNSGKLSRSRSRSVV